MQISREKIMETAKNFYIQIRSLFSVITTKIKGTPDAVLAAIRSIEVEVLKESLEITLNWFTWFLGSIFALKFTDTGKAFFSANYSVVKVMFLFKFVSFLITLLATLFQMHKINIAPLLLMLLFDSGSSLLAVSMISRPGLWISLTSWLCVFVLFGYCCYAELKELISPINRWFENHIPDGPILPIREPTTDEQ